MEIKKITSHQLFSITAFHTFGASIIYVSSSLAGFAKQDAWLAPIITTMIGVLFIWLYSYLGKLYPNKNLVEIIYSVLGKWIGGFVTVGFIVICLLDVPQITWYVGNFIQLQLSETPLAFTHTFVIIAIVIGVFYGIEAIARCSEVFMYIISFMIILTFALVSPKINVNNILPVLENGIAPVFKASLLLISFTTWPIIILNMIYPSHIENIKNARRSLFKGYLWGSFIIFLCTIMAILVLGSSIAAKSAFPTFLLAQEIHVGTIITRMEAIIAIVWVISLSFKALFYFYAGVISLSHLLKLKDHKRIILPLALLLLVLSVVVYPNTNYETQWDMITWIPFVVTFAVVLPIVLLIITFIKKRKMIKQ